MESYTQCLLIRGGDRCVAWIPSRFAILNKIVKLRFDGEWVDGWRVDHIYNTRDKEFIEYHERDYLKQRKASDI
jgi:hypothetical protein